MVQSISDFVNQVTTQQGLNLDKAKYYSLINFFPQLYNNTQGVNYILTGNYSYLSCIYISGIAYWEFISTNNSNNFSNFQFIYIVANYPNFIKLKSYVPYQYEWDINTNLVNLVYPTKSYLLDTDAYNWGQYYLINVGIGFTHPFLPTFQFTGNIVLLKKILLYEYNDINGYYGPRELNYLSPLRPLNLNYPLGIPNQLQLVNDNCYSVNNPIQYSSKGNSNLVGVYTGQYTTSSYNKHIQFWVYQNKLSKYLSEYSPAYNTQGLALSAIYNSTNISPTIFSSTFLYTFNITEYSSTSIINI